MKVIVIGAGAMGSGIAQVLAQAGETVVVYDTKPEMLTKSAQRLTQTLETLVAKGKFSQEQADSLRGRIAYSDNLRDGESSELAVEAIYENLEAKRSVFRILDDLLSETAVLASNTSSLSIASLASGIHRPERVVGLHFFNPAPLMPLVEVVPCLTTAPETVARCLAWVAGWKKTGVVAQDTPGFIVNRVARPYYGEALHMEETQVADRATIDWALTTHGGFKMGPFALMDLIGHDINYTVTETVWKQFYYDPRFRPSLAQKRLVEAGLLGRKTGRGFYDYREGAVHPAPHEDAALARTVVNRTWALIINEAYDALYRGVAQAEAIDTAMKLGVNYPMGPFEKAEQWGLHEAVAVLDGMMAETGDPRYRVCPLLRREAGSN
jgi:3-hydroxybutyryl-CoA dehydrogenase